MDPLVWSGLALRLFVLGWTLRLGFRYRAPRMWALCAVVALATLLSIGRVTWAQLGEPAWSFRTSALADLVTWSLALGAVAVFGGVLEAQGRARHTNEGRLRRIVEDAREGIWTLDTAGVTTFANGRLGQILGWNATDLHGRHLSGILPDGPRAEVAAVLEARAPEARELRLQRRDGAPIWVRMCTRPMLDEAGRRDGVLAMVEDVTHQRREAAIRRGRDQVLERLARGAPLTEVLESLCESAEDAYPEWRLAVFLAEAGGSTIALAAGPSLPRSLLHALTSLPALGQRLRGETQISEDMQALPAWSDLAELAQAFGVRSITSTPILGATMDRLGLLCVLEREPGTGSARDLEFLHGAANLAGVAVEARRAEDRVRELQGMLFAAIEQSPAGIVIADREGRVRVANSLAVGADQTSPVQVQNLPMEWLPLGWHALNHDAAHVLPEDLPLRRAIRDGETVRNEELLLRRDDGLKRWVLASAAPIRDAAGEITSGVLVLLDITERKRDERDMSRLLRSLGERKEELESIFRATSHDLRAPLVNIAGFAGELELACGELRRLLSTADLEPELEARLRPILQAEIPLDLDYIRASAQRMEQLLASLRSLIGVDRAQLVIERLDMEELLQEVLRGFEFRIRDEDATLHVGSLPPCAGDRGAVAQVLSNLIDNALKHRDPARHLEVRVQGRRLGEQCLYSVSDNGVGIPSDALERIFLPFRRHARAAVQGDGLGLTILSRLVARMAGSVRVDSQEGIGSRFEIALPASHPRSSSVPPPVERREAGEPTTSPVPAR